MGFCGDTTIRFLDIFDRAEPVDSPPYGYRIQEIRQDFNASVYALFNTILSSHGNRNSWNYSMVDTLYCGFFALPNVSTPRFHKMEICSRILGSLMRCSRGYLLSH